MQILGGMLLAALVALACASIAWGYANTVEAVAFVLKRHARQTREAHERSAARLNEGWVRELER